VAVSSPTAQHLVLASPTGLTFYKVNSLKKLHVQTLDLMEKSVTRLAAVPDLGVLALGCVTRSMDPQTGEVAQKGNFEVRDDTNLKSESDQF
jgi:DNA damage-binding protein 1